MALTLKIQTWMHGFCIVKNFLIWSPFYWMKFNWSSLRYYSENNIKGNINNYFNNNFELEKSSVQFNTGISDMEKKKYILGEKIICQHNISL